MAAPTVHPEFEWSVDAEAAIGVLGMLRADEDLEAWSKGGIDDYEALTAMTAIGSHETPFIGVYIAGTDEVRAGSNRQARVQILLGIALVTKIENSQGGSQEFLRSRVANRIRRLLEVEGGIVRNADDVEITLALLQFQRVPQPRLLKGNTLAETTLLVLFEAWIRATDGSNLLDEVNP